MKQARFLGRTWVAFTVTALLTLGPCWARAATPAVESELVQQGVNAYNELEYTQAIQLLHQALQETLTLQEKRITYMTLAFAHFALGKQAETQSDFEELLRVDERFELDRTVAPGIRAIFEKAQARVATGRSPTGSAQPGMPVLSPTVTPLHVQEGKPFELRVRYPGGAAQKLDVFYRTRGQARFSELLTPFDARGGVIVTVPGMNVKPPVVEYYMLALDETGAAVAHAGSMAQPLPVEVVAHKKPVYARGWFWGLIGGLLVAGAGAATAVYFTRTTITSTTPGTVTFQPQ